MKENRTIIEFKKNTDIIVEKILQLFVNNNFKKSEVLIACIKLVELLLADENEEIRSDVRKIIELSLEEYNLDELSERLKYQKCDGSA